MRAISGTHDATGVVVAEPEQSATMITPLSFFAWFPCAHGGGIDQYFIASYIHYHLKRLLTVFNRLMNQATTIMLNYTFYLNS